MKFSGLALAAGLAASAPLVASAASVASAAEPTPAAADDAAVKQLFESVCSNCHDLAVTTDQRKTRDGWQTTVENMIGQGAPLSDQEAARIVDYLARHYGPDSK